MCHASVIQWAGSVLTPDVVTGSTVIEVGAYDVNGSVRPGVEAHNPKSYLGVDIGPGPRVDLVCDVAELPGRFPDGFDIVISTEMLEHVVDWRPSVNALVQLVKPGGMLFISTRSPGFPFHEFPIDTWRYPVEKMRDILDAYSLDIHSCVADPEQDGVFVVAGKRRRWARRGVEVLADITIPDTESTL